MGRAQGEPGVTGNVHIINAIDKKFSQVRKIANNRNNDDESISGKGGKNGEHYVIKYVDTKDYYNYGE